MPRQFVTVFTNGHSRNQRSFYLLHIRHLTSRHWFTSDHLAGCVWDQFAPGHFSSSSLGQRRTEIQTSVQKENNLIWVLVGGGGTFPLLSNDKVYASARDWGSSDSSACGYFQTVAESFQRWNPFCDDTQLDWMVPMQIGRSSPQKNKIDKNRTAESKETNFIFQMEFCRFHIFSSDAYINRLYGITLTKWSLGLMKVVSWHCVAATKRQDVFQPERKKRPHQI